MIFVPYLQFLQNFIWFAFNLMLDWRVRPSKNELFCAVRLKLRQNHINSACFTSFALKSLNFAQILENFVQWCNFTTSAFRRSDEELWPLRFIWHHDPFIGRSLPAQFLTDFFSSPAFHWLFLSATFFKYFLSITHYLSEILQPSGTRDDICKGVSIR